MSRNLCRTNCAICSGDVKLEEAPRPVTVDETGLYSSEYMGRLTVANASCACGAKYLAWVRLSGSGGHLSNDRHEPFIDLSFRASFNDEPAAEDLPPPGVLQQAHEAECLRQVREVERQIQELQAEVMALYDRAATGKSHWELYRR